MLVSLGLDFNDFDLGIRERYHLDTRGLADLLAIEPGATVTERVALATCNRIEVYGWSGREGAAGIRADLDELARAWAPDDPAARELRSTATARHGVGVLRHLCRVAGGLESQVLGDFQILGQVRRAYRRAIDAGAAGPHLRSLFDRALHAGKRVRSETDLVSRANSVGARAAGVAAGRLGGLAGRRCVVVGCGKTGAQAARALRKLGATDLVLVNRTPERADRLARELGRGVRAASLRRLHATLAQADLAIVATGAPEPLVREQPLRRARRAAGDAGPLLLLDVSMPRNVAPAVARVPETSVLDLDTVWPDTAEPDARRSAVDAARVVVEEEVAAFVAWRSRACARDALVPLRQVLDGICRREVAFAAGDDVAERVADRIVAKVMAYPMAALRE
ncbi:MAG: glutamyl-tRNA reductase, partial [Gemmatimonadota bacterium]